MTGFDLGESATDDEPESDGDEEMTGTDETREGDAGSHNEEENNETEKEEADPRVEPAFPFSDDLRESWYVRDEIVTEFEDAVDFEAKPFLREHGVRNETGREIQDAAIQVAKNNPEELARVILEDRGVDIDDDT
ncbi:hypothetical protein [Halorussus sp. AFM4]|uniref:hypothetical protein n=1 Tax=Halorussus sp. AFM4 TaxID=3421651 RepID=UPI003EBB29A2